MGCHSLAVLRWLFDRPRVATVEARLATLLHGERARLDDDAQVVLTLENGAPTRTASRAPRTAAPCSS